MWEEVVAGGELKGLQEIRLPEPVSYTPETTAWWVLFAVLALLAAYLTFLAARHRQRNAYRRSALETLGLLRATNAVERLPLLLKHTALRAWPRIDVAALTGPAWLTFLDASYGGEGFRRGPGRVLPDLAYGAQAPGSVAEPELWDLLETWIRRHRV